MCCAYHIMLRDNSWFHNFWSPASNLEKAYDHLVHPLYGKPTEFYPRYSVPGVGNPMGDHNSPLRFVQGIPWGVCSRLFTCPTIPSRRDIPYIAHVPFRILVDLCGILRSLCGSSL